MTIETRAFDKDEFGDGAKAFVEYWSCRLARYVELYDKEELL